MKNALGWTLLALFSPVVALGFVVTLAVDAYELGQELVVDFGDWMCDE